VVSTDSRKASIFVLEYLKFPIAAVLWETLWSRLLTATEFVLRLEDRFGTPLEGGVSGRKPSLTPFRNLIIDYERYNERDQESSPLFSRYNIVTT
jgi:hypothetical protein